jgi:hypothetical protein
MTSSTEITVVTGDRYRVRGHVNDVERIILDAARGSIMQLAWVIEAKQESTSASTAATSSR